MNLCNRCGETRRMCRCLNGFLGLPEVNVSSELRRNLEADPAFAKAFGEMIQAIVRSVRKEKLK